MNNSSKTIIIKNPSPELKKFIDDKLERQRKTLKRLREKYWVEA